MDKKNNILKLLKQNMKIFCDCFYTHWQRTMIKDKKDGVSISLQHKILNHINENQGEQVMPFGTILRNEVLTPYGYAIYVDKSNRRIVLLKNTTQELRRCKESSMIRIIFDLLALFKSLEENLFIYRLLPNRECDSVIYEAAEECTPIGNSYKLNATQKLILEERHWCIKENNSIIYQECFSFEEVIYDQLKELFESLIFPTDRLNLYISYGYQSKHDYINQKSLKRAKIANWIAILVGASSLVLGPCISLPLNNKYGQMTLSDASIDSIVNAKQTIQIVRDTIFTPKQDTINCIIIKDYTKTNKNK